jgi:hypothetical protein
MKVIAKQIFNRYTQAEYRELTEIFDANFYSHTVEFWLAFDFWLLGSDKRFLLNCVTY